MKGDKTVNITIKGGGVILNIPVIPSKVNVSDGSSTPKTVTIWRKGEVDFNDGKSLDGLSCRPSSLPGMTLRIAMTRV